VSLSMAATGAARVAANLARIRKALEAEATPACVDAATIVAKAAQDKVRTKTRKLHDGIMVQPTKNGAWVRADAEVDGDKEYAGHLEYGTSKMAKEPYLRPAAEEKRHSAIQAAATRLTRAMESA
jgi:HK97 gp10 family phage protein